MSRGVRAARRAFRWTRWLILALLLPVLLVAALGQWWLLPRLNDYRDDLTGALRDYLHLPVRIEAVTAVWDGGHLSLRLQEVSLRDPDSEVAFATFSQALVTLDLWRSLREWRPAVGDLRLEGANLILEPGLEGMPRLRTTADSDAESGDAALPVTELARWLFGLRRLAIIGEQLTVRRPDGVELRFPHPYLKLQDVPQGQRLTFTVDGPDGRGGRFQFALELPNDDQTAFESGATVWRLRGGARFGEGVDRTPHPRFELTGQGARWRGRAWDWPIPEVWTWMLPWLDEPTRQWLEPLAPRGELPEITFQTEAGMFVVTARFHEVTLRPGHGLPGFGNLSGVLELTPEGGHITLDSRQISVDTGGLLRAPVTLDTLAGVVNWERLAAGLQFDSPGLELVNADLAARFWGRVTLPDTGETLLDLRTEYRGVQVDRAWRYLPVAVIPSKAVAWLDRALVGGRVVSGEGVLRGPASAFPFDQDQGLFETRFQVEDTVLDYAPGWPKLEGLGAQVTFRNRGLRVVASAARARDARLEPLAGGIDDLGKAVVRVEGRASGPGASMWRALQESPVGHEWGAALPDLRIDGGSTLELNLTMPLDGRPTQVRGRVGLSNNRVMLPVWTVDLDAVRGEVRFTESDLDARNVRALWRGAPLQLDLELAGRAGQHELRTRLRGRLDLPALLGESAGALARYVEGASDWEALLTVPTVGRERRDQMPPFTLDLDSNLRGIAVHLPAPLGKPAAEMRPLRIRLRPRERETLEAGLEYGEGVRAALELTDFASAPRFVRGELRVNAGAARLPEAPGLTVVADLPRWELGLPAGAMAVDDAGAPPLTASPLTGLRRLEGRIGELVIGNQSFPRVTLAATRHEEETRVELDSARLEGRITLPDAPAPQRPINAALRRVHLQSGEESAPREAATDTLDPRRFPPLVLTVSDLRRDDVELGRLRLIAMPLAGGVHLREFSLESDRQRISADGEWRWTDRGSVSQLRATLEAQSLNEALSVFGYPGLEVARGETQAELKTEWAGAPIDFALERVAGALQFQVGPGQLLELDPGLGRMVGLFNVQNLLRRLTLDFSDLFQPGTSFDRVAGEFIFRRGQAETGDLTIEAPAARIEIQGRIGLRARDYDQIITVTPRLGGTLPVAGALAGGPAVGAAVFVAERLLQKGIENVTRYQYALTGSWDDPVLERLDEPSSVILPPAKVGDQ